MATEAEMAAKFARVLATCDGLREDRPDECLEPWMRHARLAASFFGGYYKTIIDALEADVAKLRERLSDALAAGGDHRSDCAVHNAPAFDPGPCDCNAESAQ